MMHVNSYSNSAADFKQYKTYAFAQADRMSTGDPRLDENPFFNERMRAGIEKQMDAKGFEKLGSGADLLVHYHASFNQQVDANHLDREYGYCKTGDCRPSVYDAGTLMVDLVDRRTNALVWRGWSEGSVDGVIDNQAWMEQKVDEAMTQILTRLPHRF